jgi:hypothetical protein
LLCKVHEQFLFAIIHPFERFGESPKLKAVLAASAPPSLAVSTEGIVMPFSTRLV